MHDEPINQMKDSKSALKKYDLRMEYRLRVTGAGQTPVDIDGYVDLPMALNPKSHRCARTSFETLLRILVQEPSAEAVHALAIDLMNQAIAQRQDSESWIDAQTQTVSGTDVDPTDRSASCTLPGSTDTAFDGVHGAEAVEPMGPKQKVG